MRREEFLKQLEQLLADIPENERREAMEYYRNYFEDAGPENEAKIIEELGSPQKVASSIKKDLFGENYGAYTYMNQANRQAAYEKQKKDNRTMRNILIAVVVVLTFPIWIGLMAGAFGILVGLLACVFALAVAGIAIVGALLLMGCIFTGIGFANAFGGFPAIGLIIIAIGMACLAIGILGVLAMVWMIGGILPWVLRAVVRLCKRPFQKRGAAI